MYNIFPSPLKTITCLCNYVDQKTPQFSCNSFSLPKQLHHSFLLFLASLLRDTHILPLFGFLHFLFENKADILHLEPSNQIYKLAERSFQIISSCLQHYTCIIGSITCYLFQISSYLPLPDPSWYPQQMLLSGTKAFLQQTAAQSAKTQGHYDRNPVNLSFRSFSSERKLVFKPLTPQLVPKVVEVIGLSFSHEQKDPFTRYLLAHISHQT